MFEDRAQSEVLGFILSFSIILLSVGLVYSVGFSAVTDLRDGEQLDSAERAMVALGGTFENIERGDPARASEIRLGGGTLAVEKGTTAYIAVNNSSMTIVERKLTAGSLSYSLDGTTISYEIGSVYRQEPEGGLVSRHPRFVCTPTRAVVTVVTFNSSARSVASGGSVTTVARFDNATLLFPTNQTARAHRAESVTIDVDSPREALWDRYFEDPDTNWVPDSTEPGKATCNAEAVYLRQVGVNVRFVT